MIKTGDVVVARPGGARMTVSSVVIDDTAVIAECVWFDRYGAGPFKDRFNIKNLTVIPSR